jgi:hypothetical protein
VTLSKGRDLVRNLLKRKNKGIFGVLVIGIGAIAPTAMAQKVAPATPIDKSAVQKTTPAAPASAQVARPDLVRPPLQSVVELKVNPPAALPPPVVAALVPSTIPNRWRGLAQKNIDPRIRPPNLSRSPEPSRSPSAAAVGDDVYVAWNEGANQSQQVMTALSRDGGLTFFPPINMSNSAGRSTRGRVLANGQGVHVLWVGSTSEGQRLFISTSRDRGDTWSAPRQASPWNVNDIRFDASLDGPDPMVVFTGSRDNQNLFVVVANTSTTETTSIIAAPRSARSPVIAAQGNEVAVLFGNAYQRRELRRSVEEYVFAWSRDRGKTFMTNLSPGYTQPTPHSAIGQPGDSSNAQLFFGIGGLHLLFETIQPAFTSVDRNDQTYSRGPQHYAQAFVGGVTITPASSGFPAIPEPGRGSLFFSAPMPGRPTAPITYPSETDPAYLHPIELRSATNGGRTAYTMVLSLPGQGGAMTGVYTTTGAGPLSLISRSNARSPRAAVDAQGRSASAWLEGRDGAGEIVALVSGAQGLSNVSNSPGDSFDPEIVATAGGFFVVWDDTSSGNDDIYFAALR